MHRTSFVILSPAMCLELLNSHGMRFHFKKKKKNTHISYPNRQPLPAALRRAEADDDGRRPPARPRRTGRTLHSGIRALLPFAVTLPARAPCSAAFHGSAAGPRHPPLASGSVSLHGGRRRLHLRLPPPVHHSTASGVGLPSLVQGRHRQPPPAFCNKMPSASLAPSMHTMIFPMTVSGVHPLRPFVDSNWIMDMPLAWHSLNCDL
jgi:hypothetical protein